MAKFINKDALVAEIESRISDIEISQKAGLIKKHAAYKKLLLFNSILSLIDTLEVKEVGLDSDIRTYLTNHFNIYEDGVLQSKKSGLPLSTYDIIKVAEHFFELGLRSTITEEDCKLIWNIGDEIPNMPEEEFFKELLKRFKARKGK